jgi:cytidine deaminase
MAEPAGDLFAAARAARANAHAPYSGFAVGAALRASSGRIFAACNVENAAYPVGTCAEAGAISAMVAAGETRIVEALVTAESAAPVTPCGACRQRLREFADDSILIHAADSKGVVATFTLGALLPHSFGPDHLVSGHLSAGRLADTSRKADT